MRKLLLILVAGCALVACRPVAQRATVAVAHGVTVSLIVRPMFGLHSDWYRVLRIETPAGRLEKELPEDTGWWRGSNLYVDRTGTYVLDEGQMGCLGFTASPLARVREAVTACDKIDDVADGAAHSGIAARPDSRFYRNLRYIGRFEETPDAQQAISFTGADKQPEAELPDEM